MLLYILFAVGLAELLVLGIWAVVAIRTAVRDLSANTRRPAHRAGEEPEAWFTPADAPVDEPLYGHAAENVRKALIARGVPSDELKRRSY